MKRRLMAVTILLVAGAAHAAGEPAVYSISPDHVNLIRLDHDKIVNVVYDVEALEMQADKARGVVFVRVRPAWLAQGHRQTAAFLNAESDSYGITLTADAPASRTVTVKTNGTRVPNDNPKEAVSLVAARLPALPVSDYVGQLKAALRAAVTGDSPASRPDRLGEAFAETTGMWVEHAVPEARATLDGWVLDQRSVVVGRQWRVDVVDVMNARAIERALPWQAWAHRIPDVLAVAGPEGTWRAGGVGRLYVIRPVGSIDDGAVALLRAKGETP